MNGEMRKILHVDMDAFYASIEQRDDASLRGQPVVVGGDTRGVVAAASYEARRFGIRSAMPMREARQRCPHLQRIPPRMSHYQAVSAEIFGIFRRFTPLVEGLSLDEAFLDVSSSLQLFGSEETIARDIRRQVKEATGLNASVGVAPNKLIAKIASDLAKPDGLFVVTRANLRQVLDPLPVGVIPGIGPQTLVRLAQIGIRSVADLRNAAGEKLEPVFGRFTQAAKERAAGVDTRPVQASRDDKSISAEQTFDTDLVERAAMQRQLFRLSERATSRLRARGLVAGTVQVKIRRADFATFSRQRALRPPSNDSRTFYAIALQLLDEWLATNVRARIRLLGVAGSDLAEFIQPDLFAAGTKAGNSALDHTIDQIRDRFGDASLGRARTMNPDQIR